MQRNPQNRKTFQLRLHHGFSVCIENKYKDFFFSVLWILRLPSSHPLATATDSALLHVWVHVFLPTLFNHYV